MKKITAFILSLAMALSLAACGAKEESAPAASAPAVSAPAASVEEVPAPETAPTRSAFKVAALKGPTAMGLVSAMDSADKGELPYEFTLAGAADEVTPLLIKGELDMACVPANLASVLYNKTEGQIVTLAINTLGVI